MKRIPLTQGQFALVDDSDFESLNRFKWHAHRNKNQFYPRRAVGIPGGGQRWVRMHYDLTGQKSVDHADGNGLNNQRHNLRTASNTQQGANRGPFKNNKSGFRGVCWRRDSWVAQIGFQMTTRYLGKFSDPIAAAHAYDRAAKKYFGEFARLNFPLTSTKSNQ